MIILTLLLILFSEIIIIVIIINLYNHNLENPKLVLFYLIKWFSKKFKHSDNNEKET